MKLYKSDTKGVYLDISEINIFHLKRIIKTLEDRFALVLSRVQHNKTAHSELVNAGPSFLTQTLEGSEFATYQDLIDELNRRQTDRLF